MAKYTEGSETNGMKITGVKKLFNGVRNHAFYKFECSCGNDGEARCDKIDSGLTKSCGHCKSYKLRSVPLWMVKILKDVRVGVMFRCYNENSEKYKWYGAKGVKVCDEWLESANAFVLGVYDEVGDRPDGYSIDRIDTNGDYEPGNLRWASDSEQNRNHGRNRVLDVNGVDYLLCDCARMSGLRHQTISKRISCGRSVEEAMTMPTKVCPDPVGNLAKAGVVF